VRGLYFLDRHGFRGNRQVPAAAAVPLILQRFIHFWGYLTPAARLAAFDLFICACHSIQTYYLTVPKGMDALKWLHSRGLVGGSHD